MSMIVSLALLKTLPIVYTDGAELNRGMLKNIGFIEALRQEMYECVIFNDIGNRI